MFAEYSAAELTSIFAMQGFAGLILFSVFVLMALGLAIIFDFSDFNLCIWG